MKKSIFFRGPMATRPLGFLEVIWPYIAHMATCCGLSDWVYWFCPIDQVANVANVAYCPAYLLKSQYPMFHIPFVLFYWHLIAFSYWGGSEWPKTPSSGDTIAVFFRFLIIVLPSPPIVNRNFDKSLVCYTPTITKSLDSHVVTQSLFYSAKSLATFIIQKRTSSERLGQRSNSSFRSGSVGNEPFFAMVAPSAPDFAPPENSD
jgi:hypothetical protein